MPVGTAESPITWVVRPGLAGPMVGVVRAYAEYLAVYVRLVGAPDPHDLAMRRVSTGAAFAALVADVRGLAQAGRAIRGPVRSAPTVSTLRGDTAVVDDCADLSHFADAESAKVGSAAQPIRATLTRLDGTWLVSAVSRPAGGCVPR